MKIQKFKSLVVLCMVALIGFNACDEELARDIFVCEMVATATFGLVSFDECFAILSSDIDEFFITGENSELKLVIGGWKNQLGTQTQGATGSTGTAILTDKANNKTFTATDGTMEFTEIDQENKVATATYNFNMASGDGSTTSVEGTFENVPFEED